jgi:hypothetical protein
MLASLSLSLLPLRPPPRMAAGADDSFEVLSALVVANGGFVGPICCKSNGGLRGLYVTEPVIAGYPLCAVPRACTIHARPADGLKDNEVLMLALLEARASAEHDANAEHAAYLATMPPQIPLLRDWSAPQLARLQSAALTAAVRSQQDWVERTFAYVRPFTPWRDGLEEAAREQLDWAERVVRSRALASVGVDGSPTIQLVPLFDMCNHCGPANAAPGAAETEKREPHVILTADQMVVLCAPTALQAGEEVLFSYCDEGNARLLLDYGFAMDNSPREHAAEEHAAAEHAAAPLYGSGEPLSLPLPPPPARPAPPPPPSGSAASPSARAEPPPPLLLGSTALDAAAARRVRRLLRLARSPELPADASAGSAAVGGGAARRVVQLELAACRTMREGCEAALAAMPTSEAEDAAQLDQLQQATPEGTAEEREDAWREEAALHYRLGQKRRLRLTAAALLALQARLAAREARHAHLGLWWAAQRAHLMRRGRPARRFRPAPGRGAALVRLRTGSAAVTLEAALETVRSRGQG